MSFWFAKSASSGLRHREPGPLKILFHLLQWFSEKSRSWHGNCTSPNTNQNPRRSAAHTSANAIHAKMEIANDTHSKYGTHDVRSANHCPRLLGYLDLHPVNTCPKKRKAERFTETHNGTRSLHPFTHSVCGEYQLPYFVSKHLYMTMLASRLFPPALYAHRQQRLGIRLFLLG